MKTVTLCLAFIGLSLLTACQSTSKPTTTKNAEANQQTQYFAEAKVLLDKLKEDINQGKDDQLAYFSPGTFKIAVGEFENATEEYLDISQNGASSFNVFKSDSEQYSESKEEILNSISVSNQKLKLAYKIKVSAESTLAETFIQNTVLKDISAPEVFPRDYEKIYTRINDLIEYIDEGELSEAQAKQPALLRDMQILEVRTVRKKALGQLDSDIALIKEKNWAEFVPVSHQQLLTARNKADAIITATPRSTDEIKVAVVLAEFSLAHFYHLSKEVNALKGIEINSYEQYLLVKEDLLHTVTESLKMGDVRDLAMTQQVETIALQAGTIQDKLTTANATVLALQNDSTESSEATQSLRVEFKNQLVNLNEKYDALVIENSVLNKQIQNKDMELVRLQAYKSTAIKAKNQRVAEKKLAMQEQAKKEAEQKALAMQEQAKKEAEQKALALQEQAKKEAEQKALAQQDQLTESQVVEPIIQTETTETLVEELVEE